MSAATRAQMIKNAWAKSVIDPTQFQQQDIIGTINAASFDG
jgi:hypothetical protein